MAYQTTGNVDISITYGHDDTHIIIQFSQMIQNNRMTEKQAKDMIAALKNSIQRLTEHQQRHQLLHQHLQLRLQLHQQVHQPIHQQLRRRLQQHQLIRLL